MFEHNANLDVFGLTIEAADDDAAVNGLGWGATYPKISYHKGFSDDVWNALPGANNLTGIPAFILICPAVGDEGNSTILKAESGWAGEAAYTSEFSNCENSVNEITAEEQFASELLFSCNFVYTVLTVRKF